MHLSPFIQSPYYPYHLSWEEFNDPGIVIQRFLTTWDLPECRILLWKFQKLIADKEYRLSENEHAEMKSFLQELERLAEAVYIIDLQYKEARSKV